MKYWKIVLVVSLFASILFPGTALARVHNATGSAKFSDSDPSFSTNLSDQLTVSISDIFADAGKNYYAWLSSDDQSSFLALGILELDGSGGGSLTYTSPTGQTLIDGYIGSCASSGTAASASTPWKAARLSIIISPMRRSRSASPRKRSGKSARMTRPWRRSMTMKPAPMTPASAQNS